MSKAKAIYLDYAAATPVDGRVLTAMQPYWQDKFYNPSAGYLAGKQLNAELADWRRRLAICMGAKPTEVIFTAGGSEADNLAISGVMRQFPQANLVVSAVEHDAVLKTAEQYKHRLAPVDAQGVLSLKQLKQTIDEKTVLVSVMHANNELGSIQPLAKVAALLQDVRQQRQKTGNKLPIYLHADASQTPNYLSVKTDRLGVDLLTVNGGKIYGPKQSGALFVKTGLKLTPIVSGGGQERGLRSGTENLASIAGLTTALELAQAGRKPEAERLMALRRQFIKELNQLPGVVINGGKQTLPNIVHITVVGADNERLMMELDEQGVMCAVGSACSASSQEPSHVLRAIGLDERQARSSLRFSMGRATTAADVSRTTSLLKQLITQNQG